MGNEVGEAAELALVVLDQLDELPTEHDWRGTLLAGRGGSARARADGALGARLRTRVVGRA